MARRTRKKKSSAGNQLPMIIGAVVALVALVLGYSLLTSGKGAATFPALPTSDLQNNPSSLRGSDFSVAGKIKEKLLHSDERGSLISIEVVDNGEIYMFPILVPSDVKGPNLSVEQSYIFNGTVNSKERFVVSSYDDK